MKGVAGMDVLLTASVSGDVAIRKTTIAASRVLRMRVRVRMRVWVRAREGLGQE